MWPWPNFAHLQVSPFREAFSLQAVAYFDGRHRMEEEFKYLDSQGLEHACLMLSAAPEIEGNPDLSRVALVLIDVTWTKWTVAERSGDQTLLRKILARANILLWWAGLARRRQLHLETQRSAAGDRQSALPAGDGGGPRRPLG